MTESEKERIAMWREMGYGYASIGQIMNLSKDAVKGYCRKMGLTGIKQKTGRAKYPEDGVCKQCGMPLVQRPKTKRKVFCSETCRVTWWKAHREPIKKDHIYHFICKKCGSEFTAHGHKNRIYCSFDCYVQDRFHKEDETGDAEAT